MLTIVDERNLGYALGAAEFLTKPVDRERLVGLLHRVRPAAAPGVALVVDDEPAVRAVIRRQLEREGWVVEEAANGRAALERLAARRPDVVLLDLVMPEMDGFELAAELRRREAWRTIPVVAVTARDLTEEDRRRLEGQVDRLLQKGIFPRDELLRDVAGLVAGAPRTGRRGRVRRAGEGRGPARHAPGRGPGALRVSPPTPAGPGRRAGEARPAALDS